MGIDKAQLVTPALDWEQADLPATYAGWFLDVARFQLWMSFVALPREIVALQPGDYPETYWRAVLDRAHLVGEKPILLLPYGQIVRDVGERQWLGGKPDFLEITRDENLGNDGGVAYHVTVNGIDVYTIHLPQLSANQSILFSATALQEIIHHDLGAGHIADVAFTAGPDPKQSELQVSYSQETKWRETRIFEFRMSPPTDEDDQSEPTEAIEATEGIGEVQTSDTAEADIDPDPPEPSPSA